MLLRPLCAALVLATTACASGPDTSHVDDARVEGRSRLAIQNGMHAMADEVFGLLLLTTEGASRDAYGYPLNAAQRVPGVLERLDRIDRARPVQVRSPARCRNRNPAARPVGHIQPA